MTAGIAALFSFVIMAAVYLRWRRLRTLALNWPAQIGFSRFSNRVNVYLKHHGWTIIEAPLAIHIKIARRGTQAIRLICLPSLVEYNSAKIRDLSQIAMGPGPRPLVCVTTVDVKPHVKAVAAIGQVVLLHYKKLTVFAASDENQTIAIKGMREAFLEKVRSPSID